MACAVPVFLTAGCGADSPPKAEGEVSAAEVKAVTDTFERFFDSSISVDQKTALLENGQAFTETLEHQAHSAVAGGATASVSAVAGDGPQRAAVTFTIKKHGIPLLPNRHGTALELGGSWKVAAATFCDLLRIEGGVPAACDAAAATAPQSTGSPQPTG
ncbi:hypothetical protein NS14008_09985 [Nocardia seriolae]|nr:hypothetical protein NS14008_09985 [Nocardia seriolae]PSK32243.1 hypothetical protein C6575_06505 [Nocardia seriolae]RLP32553.1 hypothetical protein D6158_06875 [Nocardia seriolae]